MKVSKVLNLTFYWGFMRKRLEIKYDNPQTIPVKITFDVSTQLLVLIILSYVVIYTRLLAKRL